MLFEIIALARPVCARLKIVPARAPLGRWRPGLPAPLIEHFRTSAAAARRGAVGRSARGGRNSAVLGFRDFFNGI